MTNSNEELVALAERCEAATRPDRLLDAEIWIALDEARGKLDALTRFGEVAPWVLPVTASLDAAMALVPEGWARGIHLSPGFKATAELFLPGRVPGVRGAAVTETLALCAAALRARASIPPQAMKE